MPDTCNLPPVTSITELSDLIKQCVAQSESLRITGNGTDDMRFGRSAGSDRNVSLRRLSGVTEHVPEDLVITVNAGTTLAELQQTLAKQGQWLPVEPPLPERRTLGGIVAGRASTLCRAGYGSVRDWLIGVDLVDAFGRLVKGGGKVVKNVSGYDLPKLYCGSFGTLGAIVALSFKVSPLPEVTQCLLAVLSKDRNSEDAIDALIASSAPVSAHLMNSEAAKRILGSDSPDAQYLFVRFAGYEEAVSEQIQGSIELLAPYASSITPLPQVLGHSLVESLRDFSHLPASATIRYHILSSQAGAYVRMLDWTAARGRMRSAVLADVVCGIVTAHFDPIDDLADWTAFYPLIQDKADRVGGSRILEQIPAEWDSPSFPVWSPILPDLRIMRAIKQALDPNGVFSPGRFYGGL